MTTDLGHCDMGSLKGWLLILRGLTMYVTKTIMFKAVKYEF